jgi:hypothetical protein
MNHLRDLRGCTTYPSDVALMQHVSRYVAIVMVDRTKHLLLFSKHPEQIIETGNFVVIAPCGYDVETQVGR